MAEPLPQGFQLDPPSQEAQQLPEGFTLDAAQEPTQKPSFLESALGGLESAASIITGAAAIIPAGIVGLATAADPFAPEGSGGERVKQVQEALTFQPRSETGKAEQAAVAEKLRPIGEAIANFEESVGAGALEATGSPVLGALAKALPAATAEILTLGAATPVVAGARQVAKRAVAGTKDIVKKIPQSQTKQRIAKLIQEGVADVETARFKLKDPGVPTPAKPVKLQQSITTGAPKIVKDKIATESIKQGFDEGVIAAIKGSAPIDKAKMLRMVGIMEKGKKNKLFAQSNRPSDVAGDSLMSRVRVVQGANKAAGKQIDSVAKSLKGQKIDFIPIGERFIKKLDDMGINVTDDLKLDFKGSDIEGLAGPERAIKQIFNRMKTAKINDAFEAHRLKRFIDEQVTFGKNAEGLAGRAEKALKDLRRDIRLSLSEQFPKYARVNTVYSETIEALDAFQNAAGKKMDLTGPNADKATGTLMRRLMGNVTSRINLLDSIKEIERTADKFKNFKSVDTSGRLIEGPEVMAFKDDLLTQILFVDELDAVFGPVARTSFQGQIKQAVIPRTATDIAIKVGEKVIEKARGINEPAAFKTIKELLKEGL